MKKWFLIAAVVIVVAAIALPVSNLLASKRLDPQVVASTSDTELATALPILETSCADCHTASMRAPIYMKLPIAKSMIERDIENARARFDMDREVFALASDPSQAALTKVEQALEDDTMPPNQYTLMHWDATIGDHDRDVLEGWIHSARARANGAENSDDPLLGESIVPLVAIEGLDPVKVELGRSLYHDVRLSGDDTISCATCHDLAKGGTDQAPVSTGINGQLGGINAPTTLNAALHLAQFWDGRAADLAAQADGPPNNPIEMGSNWDQILAKLRADRALTAAFDAAYGELTAEAVRDAIATYEKTLITVDSPFDRYLRGDETALTEQQVAGWKLFDAHGCDTCHAGPAMGGTSYERMGVTGDYFDHRGTPLTDADRGRFNVTDDDWDLHRFKVPTLRNVELTAPYFHDGSVETLDQAVRTMAEVQLGRPLNDEETAAVVAFLEAQTGTLEGQPLTTAS